MKQFLFLVFTFFVAIETYAQVNPFLNTAPKDSVSSTTFRKKHEPSRSISEHIWLRIPFSKKLTAMQRDLTNTVSASLRHVKEHADAGIIAGLLFLAFIYGVIHSLGPGHAKLLFLSHTLTHPTSAFRIFSAGVLFSLVHTGTSLLLFLFLKIFLGFGQATIGMYTQKMINISGALIILAGILTLFANKIESITQRSVNHFTKGASSINTIAVIAGIAPCPGAFLIMTFSNTIGIFYIGILAVTAVSIGMALTVSVAGSAGGFVATQSKRYANFRFNKIIGQVFRCMGAGIIILIGLSLVLK